MKPPVITDYAAALIDGAPAAKIAATKAPAAQKRAPHKKDSLMEEIILSGVPPQLGLIGGMMVRHLMQVSGGFSYGSPNERGLRILAAVGTELTPAEHSELFMLADWGPPKTEKFWDVLLAMKGCRDVAAYRATLEPVKGGAQ